MLCSCDDVGFVGRFSKRFYDPSEQNRTAANPVSQARYLGNMPLVSERVEATIACIPDGLFARIIKQPESHLVCDIREAQSFIRITHCKTSSRAGASKRAGGSAERHASARTRKPQVVLSIDLQNCDTSKIAVTHRMWNNRPNSRKCYKSSCQPVFKVTRARFRGDRLHRTVEHRP